MLLKALLLGLISAWGVFDYNVGTLLHSDRWF